MSKAFVFLRWMAVLACTQAAAAEYKPLKQAWLQEFDHLDKEPGPDVGVVQAER